MSNYKKNNIIKPNGWQYFDDNVNDYNVPFGQFLMFNKGKIKLRHDDVVLFNFNFISSSPIINPQSSLSSLWISFLES